MRNKKKAGITTPAFYLSFFELLLLELLLFESLPIELLLLEVYFLSFVFEALTVGYYLQRAAPRN